MDPLEKATLGRTDVQVTRFGFGGAPLGERFHPVDNATATAIVDAAYAAGINYFDTAPQYGQGKSESRLGHGLNAKPRDSFLLSTKVGHLYGAPKDRARLSREIQGGGFQFACHSDYSRDGVLRSYEDSLLRLGLNRVDMLAIHDIDVSYHGSSDVVDRHFEELTRGGGWRALEELKRSGDIRGIGCGVNQLGTVPEILDRGEVDFFLVAMPYTLLDQGALDEEFPLCLQRGVSVVIGAVFASGILATGPSQNASYGYTSAPEEIRLKAQRIQRVCEAHGVTLQAAALQFPLFHPAVAAIIPGAYRAENIDNNLAAFRSVIPVQLWSDLVAEGLIRSDAPTPAG